MAERQVSDATHPPGLLCRTPPLSHTLFPRAVLVPIGRPPRHHISAPGSARPSPAGVGCQGDCVAPSDRRERLLAHCAESTPGGGPARPAQLSERGRRPAARAAPAGPTGAGESQKVTCSGQSSGKTGQNKFRGESQTRAPGGAGGGREWQPESAGRERETFKSWNHGEIVSYDEQTDEAWPNRGEMVK